MAIGGMPFTDRDVQHVIPALRAEGLSWDRVAQRMGRPSGKAVRMRWEKEQERQAQEAPGTTRTCMTCRTPFQSPHCGVRMCDPCRASVAASFEPEYG